MNGQVMMDAHMKAIHWLEENLDEPLFMMDTDDMIGLIEQVVMA